jgi:hypothetical protein
MDYDALSNIKSIKRICSAEIVCDEITYCVSYSSLTGEQTRIEFTLDKGFDGKMKTYIYNPDQAKLLVSPDSQQIVIHQTGGGCEPCSLEPFTGCEDFMYEPDWEDWIAWNGHCN